MNEEKMVEEFGRGHEREEEIKTRLEILCEMFFLKLVRIQHLDKNNAQFIFFFINIQYQSLHLHRLPLLHSLHRFHLCHCQEPLFPETLD